MSRSHAVGRIDEPIAENGRPRDAVLRELYRYVREGRLAYSASALRGLEDERLLSLAAFLRTYQARRESEEDFSTGRPSSSDGR